MSLTLGSIKSLGLSLDPDKKRRGFKQNHLNSVQTQMSSLLRQGPSGEDTAAEWPLVSESWLFSSFEVELKSFSLSYLPNQVQ